MRYITNPPRASRPLLPSSPLITPLIPALVRPLPPLPPSPSHLQIRNNPSSCSSAPPSKTTTTTIQLEPGRPRLAAEVTEPTRGIRLRVLTTAPGMQVCARIVSLGAACPESLSARVYVQGGNGGDRGSGADRRDLCPAHRAHNHSTAPQRSKQHTNQTSTRITTRQHTTNAPPPTPPPSVLHRRLPQRRPAGHKGRRALPPLRRLCHGWAFP